MRRTMFEENNSDKQIKRLRKKVRSLKERVAHLEEVVSLLEKHLPVEIVPTPKTME